jgi:hypothetical protein
LSLSRSPLSLFKIYSIHEYDVHTNTHTPGSMPFEKENQLHCTERTNCMKLPNQQFIISETADTSKLSHKGEKSRVRSSGFKFKF